MNTTSLDEARAKPNTFCLTESVTINKSAAEVFEILVKDIPDRIVRSARNHEEPEMLAAGETAEDTVINDQGVVDEQEILDHLEIKIVVPNKLIHVSYDPPSEEQGPQFIRNISGFYNLQEIGLSTTQLTLTQVVQVSNFWIKLLGMMIGAKRLLAPQLREELNALKSEIEKGEYVS